MKQCRRPRLKSAPLSRHCRLYAAWLRPLRPRSFPKLGQLSRFESPRQLMGYSGLVAREYSSGNRIQRGSITKTGNAHLRRVIVEAAWAYQHRPNVIGLSASPAEVIGHQ